MRWLASCIRVWSDLFGVPSEVAKAFANASGFERGFRRRSSAIKKHFVSKTSFRSEGTGAQSEAHTTSHGFTALCGCLWFVAENLTFKTFYFLFFCSRTSSHKYTHRSAHSARGFDVKVDCLGSLGLLALEQGFTSSGAVATELFALQNTLSFPKVGKVRGC